MKRAVIFVVLAMVVIGSLAAQSVNNDAQRIVGTWVCTYNSYTITLVLNANGSGTVTYTYTDSSQNFNGTFIYGVSVSGELIWAETKWTQDNRNGYITGKIAFSPDGKILIIGNFGFRKK